MDETKAIKPQRGEFLETNFFQNSADSSPKQNKKTRMKFLQSVAVFSAFLVAKSEGASYNLNHGTTIAVKSTIDPSEKYHLDWSLDTAKGEITFEIEAETKGYIGFGLSPNGAMTGADLFIAGVYDNGTRYSGDYYGTSNGPPTLDKHDDWSLLDAKENETHTIIKFSRALDTCDEEDFPIKEGDTSRMIWSIGSNDEVDYHSERGTVSVNFFIPEPPFDTSKFKSFDIMVDMEMPAQDTTYWCTLHKGPAFDAKQHVVGFEANLLSEDAEKYTHHFTFFRCSAPDDKDPDEFFGQWKDDKGGHCYSGEVEFFPYCVEETIYVWAKGGKRMVFPEDVGYPIGEPLGKSQYYMLEVHYDNPLVEVGKKFETGLRAYYTPELRNIDAALMLIGHDINPSTVVPPQTKDFIVVGHCASECTKQQFPEEGITVFSSLLHAHLSGRKLKVRHFRNGEELPWIDNDGHYDFNFQQNKLMTNFVKILPGDHVTYECTYDSTWNEENEAITGGFSSRDEMCEWIFWYYPKVEMMSCHSTYPLDQGLKEFGITNYQDVMENGFPAIRVEEPENMRGSYVDAISFKFNWTEEFLKEFQEKRRFGEHEISCDGVGPGKVKYPEIKQEYVPEGKCDSGAGKTMMTTLFLPIIGLLFKFYE